jgi:hypothetical protein
MPSGSSVGMELTIPHARHWTMSSWLERAPLVQLNSSGVSVPLAVAG